MHGWKFKISKILKFEIQNEYFQVLMLNWVKIISKLIIDAIIISLIQNFEADFLWKVSLKSWIQDKSWKLSAISMLLTSTIIESENIQNLCSAKFQDIVLVLRLQIFSCSTQLSMKLKLLIKTWSWIIKTFLAFKLRCCMYYANTLYIIKWQQLLAF